MHVIEQFNGGLYDTIIASDEKLIDQNDEEKLEDNKNKNPKNNSKRFSLIVHI